MNWIVVQEPVQGAFSIGILSSVQSKSSHFQFAGSCAVNWYAPGGPDPYELQHFL